MSSEEKRLALVIDNSRVVADYRVNEIFAGWGLEADRTKRAETFSERAIPSLFDDVVATRLNLSNADEAKRMVKIIETEGTDFIADGFVIIAVGVNRNSLKKLEKLVVDNGGTVYATKASDGASNVSSLLNEFYFSREVKTFLKEHVGNSVEMLIPILKTVSSLKPEQQKRIQLEDILLRISPDEGEIEPWAVENHILAGDVSEAIRTLRRITKHSHELVPLSILKKNFSLMHNIKMLTISAKMSAKELAEILPASEKQIQFIQRKKLAGLNVSDTTMMIQHVAETEAKMKGGSVTNVAVEMEILVVKLCSFFS